MTEPDQEPSRSPADRSDGGVGLLARDFQATARHAMRENLARIARIQTDFLHTLQKGNPPWRRGQR